MLVSIWSPTSVTNIDVTNLRYDRCAEKIPNSLSLESIAFTGWESFLESESEKEELNSNWFNQLFQQTKSDIEDTNEETTTNETITSENIETTTTIATTTTFAITTTTENKIEWPVWSFDWGDFGIGETKKENDIRDPFLPSDNWLSDESQSEEWLSNQWVGDDDSSIGLSSFMNTGWQLGSNIFPSDNWSSNDQFDQSNDQSDESLSFEWMSEDDSSSNTDIESSDGFLQTELLSDNQSFFKSIWSDTITEIWNSDQDEGSGESTIEPQTRIKIDYNGSGSGSFS